MCVGWCRPLEAPPNTVQTIVSTCRVASCDSIARNKPAGGGCRMLATRPTAEALVGATVAVWWGGDDAWYTGTVAKYCSSDKGGKNAGRHWIKYEDGDRKWHLLDHPFEVSAAAALRCL